MKVCFVQHASEYPLFIPLVRELVKQGVEPVFVCKTPEVHVEYQKAGFASTFISEIFRDTTNVSRQEKEECDAMYGPPGIKEVCVSDLHLEAFFGSDENAKESLVVQAIKFWEAFFDAQKIEYLIMRETATFATRTAYVVAKKRGIPFMQLSVGPADDTFCMLDVGESYAWRDLVTGVTQKTHFPLSVSQKEEVKTFIASRLHKENTLPLRYVPPALFSSLHKLAGTWLYDTKKNRQENPIKVASMIKSRKDFLKKLYWKYWTRPLFRYDQVEDEKYVYFPFYSGNETNYLTMDHHWSIEQIALIKEVALSLPSGYSLYVKEHPFNPGYFTYPELREMQRIPNVKVLPPTLSTFDLIEKCSGIVTLEGTVGWEGFLAQKPIVCLGMLPYYAYSPLVYSVGNIGSLTQVLWQSLRAGSTVYTENQEEWLWFIYQVISTCSQGSLVRLHPPYGFSDDSENARKMAEQIWKRMQPS